MAQGNITSIVMALLLGSAVLTGLTMAYVDVSDNYSTDYDSDLDELSTAAANNQTTGLIQNLQGNTTNLAVNTNDFGALIVGVLNGAFITVLLTAQSFDILSTLLTAGVASAVGITIPVWVITYAIAAVTIIGILTMLSAFLKWKV